MRDSRIILIGERDERKRAHVGIEASLALFHRLEGRVVGFEWVRTDVITSESVHDLFSRASGAWCVPGSPYASLSGALCAIRHAREKRIPFIGTCGGFQHALMEFAGSVLRLDAPHQELSPDAALPLIAKLSCSLVGTRAKVIAKTGSAYAHVMERLESEEEFNCSYGMAAGFENAFAGSDLEFVARDELGQVRVFWHRRHPFFVGTLFQPERRALSGELHPLVHAFLGRT
jgi:CTP synthase (UTP-ammonia lyase)